MPSLAHLAATASLDLYFERTIIGMPAKLRNNQTAGGLFVNLCRLTDKALREYEAARNLLNQYRSASGQPVVNPQAIDHMENCVEATHRAVLSAKGLRDDIGLRIKSLAVTTKQVDDLRLLRNRLIHIDEKLVQSRIRPGQHFSLMLTEKRIEISDRNLTYQQLANAITKCHRTIEKIRGRPTTAPPPVRSGDQSVRLSPIFAEVLGRVLTQL